MVMYNYVDGNFQRYIFEQEDTKTKTVQLYVKIIQ